MRDLVHGCWCGGKRVGGIAFPPVPQAQVAAVLAGAGVPSSVADAPAETLSERDLHRRLSPGDLLLCMSSPLSASLDLPFLARARRATGARTVLYGAFPTFRPEEAIRSEGIDFIVAGEPEAAVSELGRRLSRGEAVLPGSIPGVGCRGMGGEPIAPDRRADPPDLDALPFPDRSSLPDPRRYFNPVVRNARFTTAFTSRGCFGSCTFCSSANFHGGTVRYRSAESVLEELGLLRAQRFREVFFRDELFTGNRKRLETLCAEMPRRGLRFDWVCSTRVDRIDDASARMMKEAGCHLVRMGVESGSPGVLARIRKGITPAQTRKAFDACRKAGLDTHAHTMVGMPGETREDFRMTLELVREIRPTWFTMSICTPFPGTALHDGTLPEAAASDDYLSAGAGAGLHSAAAFNRGISAMGPAELEDCVRTAYRAFYLRGGYLAGQALGALSPGMLLRRARAGFRVLDMAFRRPA